MKKYILSIGLILVLFLTTGCKKRIVGKWKAYESDYDFYFIFNKDKTCSYEMDVARLDCTYEEEDSKLIILYAGKDTPNTYEYRLEKNTLYIKDEYGKDNKFVRKK